MNFDLQLVSKGEHREGSYFRDYIVVRGRGGHWLRFLDNSGGLRAFSGYSELAWRALWEGWWNGFDDWIPVSLDTCRVCGHPTPLCTFCREEARHFFDWNGLTENVYLCDRCKEKVVPDDELLLEEGVELGMVACCDGCECDTW